MSRSGNQENGWDRKPRLSSNQVNGDVHGAALQTGSVYGGVHFHHATTTPDLLHQLPPVSPHFVNRSQELEDMTGIATETRGADQTVLLSVAGLGGIGKTELAVRFLRQLGGRVTGHLFVDLRGFARDETIQPTEVLHRFLRALAVPAGAIPPDLATRASWWRSATTGRGLGILLDNVLSAAQVRALLPGPGSHVVVVTSRARLAGLTLHGAHFVHLDPLETSDATALLIRLTARSADTADTHVARRVATLCGGLPIALNAVGVQAAGGLPLSSVESDLARRVSRLSVLSQEEESVRSAFDLSYDALDAATARTYRRLGWHVGPDITVPVARSLTGNTEVECTRALRTLAAASLLTDHGGGRYRFHDLLGLHARDKARDEETALARDTALHRLATEHAERARAADRTLRPYAGPPMTPTFTSPEQALDWLESERANLLALVEDAASHSHTAAALGITEGLWPLYLHRRDAAGWLQAATATMGLIDDPPTRARLLSKQALALGYLRHHTEAQTAFDECEQIWEQLGDTWRVSQTRQRRGLLALGLGHSSRALEHLQAARTLQEELDQPHDLAITLLGMGRALNQTGRVQDAAPLLRRAVETLQRVGDANHTTRATIALARATMTTHQDQALGTLDAALNQAQERGSLVAQAEAYEALGDLAAYRSDTTGARAHYGKAVRLLMQMGSTDIAAQIEQRAGQLGKHE